MPTLNFILRVLCLSLTLAVAADHDAFVHRRDHADLGRLIKKRALPNILDSQPSLQASSPSFAAQLTQSTAAAAQTTSANSASVQTTSAVASASASASPSTTGGGDLLSSALSGLVPTGSSSASSALSTTSSSPATYTPQTSAHASATPATTLAHSILYLTSGSTPTPTQTSSTSSSSGISHAAVTVLIVIAASVGAAVIVWTIIRKWKFRPSSDFEGRMQPIDWQPDGSNEDAGRPAHHRPSSRASSFHSGNPHIDEMRGPTGGHGTTTLSPIPDHDFTAGPVHLAPVGGYADLARGASPQPVMQESYRGTPSINRPVQYDQYGVPLYNGYSGY